jgi:hypothetical protein
VAGKFYEKKEYLWEYEWPFGEFLRESLPTGSYRRKFSMTGNGIYNLVTLDSKLYEVTLKSATKLLPNDGKKAFRDTTKDKLIDLLKDKLSQLGVNYTVNSGKFITFELFGFVAKLEIVKKTTEPA